jgi:hypothetical protein
VENCPCAERDLVLSLTALIWPARTVRAIRAVTTSGTTITPWRPKLGQVLHASFFSRKSPLELNEAHGLLLHLTPRLSVDLGEACNTIMEQRQ